MGFFTILSPLLHNRLYCTDSKGKNICVKAIQWDKLWYDFPVFIVSHYGEQAVSFKKVNLPESPERTPHRGYNWEISYNYVLRYDRHPRAALGRTKYVGLP